MKAFRHFFTREGLRAFVSARLLPSLSYHKTAARIFAAYLSYVALTLSQSTVPYSDLAYADGTSFAAMLLVTLLFFVLYTAVSCLVPHLASESWFLMLASTVAAARALGDYAGNKDTRLVLLGVLCAYLLVAFYFLTVNGALFARFDVKDRYVKLLAIAVALVSFSGIALVGCFRYLSFSSPNYDFGLFCNMFHHMRETGLPLVTSERDQLLSHFAVHMSPVYYLLLPFYFFFPSPLTLQIGQAAVLALGVIPVYLLCRHFALSGKLTVLLCGIYALYPALSAGTFYDLHENCFRAPLLLFTFYFFEKRRYIPAYIFVLLTLSVKEDAAIYLVIFAAFLLLSRRSIKHGVIVLLVSCAYFALSTYLLNTYGTGVMVSRFDNLILHEEEGLLGAVRTALTNPLYLLTQLFTTGANNTNKLFYFLQMLLPLAFLPFCSKKPSRWLLLVPMLMNLLTYYQYQYDIGFQYQFGITAFLVYAMILNAREMKAPARARLVGMGAFACLCLYLFTVAPKVTTYIDRYYDYEDSWRAKEAVLDTLPHDASVTASSFLIAHIADRDEIYEINYHKDEGGKIKTDTEYVVFDMRYKEDYEKYLPAFLAAGYTEVTKQANIHILKAPVPDASGEE